MLFRLQKFKAFSRKNIRLIFKSQTPILSSSWKTPAIVTRNPIFNFLGKTEPFRFVHSDLRSLTQTEQDPGGDVSNAVQSVPKSNINSTKEEIRRALDQCGLALTEDSVLQVLKRYRSDWKPAYAFFNWVRIGGRDILTSSVYNEILDILGKMRRFDEMTKVFDEMSERENLVDEDTYRTFVNRYAAAHKVEEAINVFHRRRDFGIEIDLVAFQKLLMCLCRYKHVEVAETLFHSKRSEFVFDIKMWNIILNGWCVLGSVYEAKRFWKDIIASKCRPDLFTYGTFINALSKKGKLGTMMKLFRGMWEKGYKPDVAICNCVIDALCFKKRIPEALEVLQQMTERGPSPNVVTYNSLIKHLCKIQRMEKVYEFLDEMEEKGGSCSPNDITFNFLLNSLRKPEEVPVVLVRMERNGCNMTSDTYNLILKLFMDWDCQERVQHTWDEMEKKGFGPDRRSYTIMIHGFYDHGRKKDALSYYSDMTSKGMIPEPRTVLLVKAMNTELNEGKKNQQNEGANMSDKSSRPMHKRKRKMRAS